MRLLVWGGWQATVLESVVRALRAREAKIFVQVVADAKSIDFCNVKPDEFIRAGVCDLEALRRTVGAIGKGGPVVVLLDGWSLLREEGLALFLTEMLAQRWNQARFVLVAPPNWRSFSTRADCLPRHSTLRAQQREALFVRAQQLMEFALNFSHGLKLIQSPPLVEQAAAACGLGSLVPIRKLGFWFAPKLLLTQTSCFVSRERLLESLVPALLNEGNRSKKDWYEEVRGDKNTPSLRQTWREAGADGKSGAPSQLLLHPCSWSTYAVSSGLSPVVCREQNGVAVPANLWAEWIFTLAVLEANYEQLSRIVESGLGEVFDRSARARK